MYRVVWGVGGAALGAYLTNRYTKKQQKPLPPPARCRLEPGPPLPPVEELVAPVVHLKEEVVSLIAESVPVPEESAPSVVEEPVIDLLVPISLLLEEVPVLAEAAGTKYSHPIMKFGYPDQDNVYEREGYVFGYDTRLRNARWVCEHLDQTSFSHDKNVTREGSTFKEDHDIPEEFRARLADYKDTVFDRGHLTPAGDHKANQKVMNDTFYLSNISPQIGNGFNRHYWARFEQFSRNLLADWNDVYICTGPLWLPKETLCRDGKTRYYVNYEMIGNPPNVAVPTHFFKVIVGHNKLKKESEEDEVDSAIAAFVIPNAKIHPDDPLEKYVVDKALVDHYSGSIFFPKLKDTLAPKTIFKDVTDQQQPVIGDATDRVASTVPHLTQRAEPDLIHFCCPFTYPAVEEPASAVAPVAWLPPDFFGVAIEPLVQIFPPTPTSNGVYPSLCQSGSCILPPPNFWVPATDASKALIQEQIKHFLEDGEKTKMEFAASLSAAERKIVHAEAEKHGLSHWSDGIAVARHVVLEKKPTPP